MKMSESMNGRITDALIRIMRQTGVRIIYAVESGSRAWEFASQDSDYDVRFIYTWQKHDYLRIDTPQDTIERMEGDLDLAGWDIYKALRLFRKSNPPLLEWLSSPVIYAEHSPQIAKLRELARQSYSSSAIFHHYSRMAHRNYRQYISNKILSGETEVPLKKYLYVVRPMIALLYIEQHKALSPTSFLETLKNVEVDNDIRKAILELVGKKQSGHELGMGPSIPVLNAFADEHLSRWLECDPDEEGKERDFRVLDDIVMAILNEE
jgi:predicted nucleotidyltransferase